MAKKYHFGLVNYTKFSTLMAFLKAYNENKESGQTVDSSVVLKNLLDAQKAGDAVLGKVTSDKFWDDLQQTILHVSGERKEVDDKTKTVGDIVFEMSQRMGTLLEGYRANQQERIEQAQKMIIAEKQRIGETLTKEESTLVASNPELVLDEESISAFRLKGVSFKKNAFDRTFSKEKTLRYDELSLVDLETLAKGNKEAKEYFEKHKEDDKTPKEVLEDERQAIQMWETFIKTANKNLYLTKDWQFENEVEDEEEDSLEEDFIEEVETDVNDDQVTIAYGEDGNPLLDEEGNPVFVDGRGNIIVNQIFINIDGGNNNENPAPASIPTASIMDKETSRLKSARKKAAEAYKRATEKYSALCEEAGRFDCDKLLQEIQVSLNGEGGLQEEIDALSKEIRSIKTRIKRQSKNNESNEELEAALSEKLQQRQGKQKQRDELKDRYRKISRAQKDANEKWQGLKVASAAYIERLEEKMKEAINDGDMKAVEVLEKKLVEARSHLSKYERAKVEARAQQSSDENA